MIRRLRRRHLRWAPLLLLGGAIALAIALRARGAEPAARLEPAAAAEPIP